MQEAARVKANKCVSCQIPFNSYFKGYQSRFEQRHSTLGIPKYSNPKKTNYCDMEKVINASTHCYYTQVSPMYNEVFYLPTKEINTKSRTEEFTWLSFTMCPLLSSLTLGPFLILAESWSGKVKSCQNFDKTQGPMKRATLRITN